MTIIATILLFIQAGSTARQTPRITLVTSAVPQAVRAGGKVSLALDVTPKPGIHVYAPGQEGYIAIALTLDASPAFTTTGSARYPAGEKFLMPALHETQIVYQKPFRITQTIVLAATRELKSSAADVVVKGTVRYQACDDKVCFLPATIPVTWTIKHLQTGSSFDRGYNDRE
jgi:DsbC/DsbD-like thiol-disulfide interchange protein